MLSSLVTAFRQHYSEGSLVSELISIDNGLYIVRVAISVDGLTLSAALAAHSNLEAAEDSALERAFSRLALSGGATDSQSSSVLKPTPVEETASVDSPAVQSSTITPDITVSETVPTRATTVSQPVSPKRVAVEANGLEPLESNAGWPLLSDLPLLVDPSPETATAPIAPESPTVSLVPSPLAHPPAPAPTLETSAFDHDFLNLEGIPTPSIDLSDIIAQTDVELQRLGWSVSQGREFLEKTYGKRSRHDLTDEELLEFLLFLETQPTSEY